MNKTVKKSTKKVVSKKVEKVVEEKTVGKRTTDTAGAKAKAKKIVPTDVQDLVKSVVEICTHAYDLQKPKEKDIQIGEKEKPTVETIHIKIPCNWGKFLHKAQVELYIKHFANKLGFIETGFNMDDAFLNFYLIGPFKSELLQESF